MGFTAGVRYPAGTTRFSPVHTVHSGYAAHSATYPMGTRGSLLVFNAAMA